MFCVRGCHPAPQALLARLARLRDAGTDDLKEKADIQEALIRSEEQRLALARTLIDFQVGAGRWDLVWEGGWEGGGSVVVLDVQEAALIRSDEQRLVRTRIDFQVGGGKCAGGRPGEGGWEAGGKVVL